MNLHLKITKSIIAKNSWANKTYCYYDICAGDGGDFKSAGSPIIASKLIDEIGMMARKVFIEENPRNFNTMKVRLGDYASGSSLLNEDHSLFLTKSVFYEKHFGILYYDPNGDPFVRNKNMIVDFYNKRNTDKIDFLLYASFTNIKRVKCSPLTRRTWGFIDDIERINKKHWLVREPVGQQQWTFLFGTNWTDFPKFKKIGLHDINSREGKKIMLTGNHSKKEILENNIDIPKIPEQMDLFPRFSNGLEIAL